MTTSLLPRMREIVSVLRLTKFDTSTEQGRARERHRRAALSSATSVLARGLAVATGIVTVPLTIGYLGKERYGLWLTISSLVAMLSFADLGMGNGLLTAIAGSHGRGDVEESRRYTSSAFVLLTAIALGIALLALGSYPLVPWARLLNLSSPEAAREGGLATLVLVGCFAAAMPLNVVQQVQLAHQEGFEGNLWQAAGQVMALGGVVIAASMRASLPWLVFFVSGLPLFVTLGNSVVTFGRSHRTLRPSWRYRSAGASRTLFGSGLLFMMVQLASTFVFASDNLVIAQILGPESVPEYGVPIKLFILLQTGASLVVGPLWPAYGEAAACGDIAWVETTLWRSSKLVLAAVVPAAVGLVVFGPAILRAWVGPAVHPSTSMLAAMAVLAVLLAFGTALAMFLNGTGILRFQLMTATLYAVGGLVAKIVMARRFGIAGVAWAAALSCLVLSIAPTTLLLPRVLAKLRRASGPKESPS